MLLFLLSRLLDVGEEGDHEAGDTRDAPLDIVITRGSEDFGEISDKDCLAPREDRVRKWLGIGDLPLLGMGES